MDGWIKLYRKLWHSDMFQGFKNKSNMILVFIWWLTHAKDGKCTFGRDQIHRDTGLNSSSVQRAISNLALSVQEVNYQPNNPFSTVLILNWHKYQDKPIEQPISNRSATDQQPITNKNKNKNKESNIFDHFWSKYPRKVSKKKTLEIWKRINPSKNLADKIMASLDNHINSRQWKKDNGAFIPHPSTWLNQERWNDELEVDQESKVDEFMKQITGGDYER
jgi:hypothetical protein